MRKRVFGSIFLTSLVTLLLTTGLLLLAVHAGLTNDMRQRLVTELPEIGKQRFAAMPPQRRTIFALSRQENLSRQEIARRLGVSVRTVDKHLELALREIRLRIKDFQWVLLLFLFR